MQLPHLPDGFSPDLITTALHRHGVLPQSARVTAVTPSQVGDGTGMMSELARLTLAYAGDAGAAPESLIGKFASQIETNREIALSYHLYERETRYFSELDPVTSTRTPVIYYSGCDEDRFLILMEDLHDYAVGSQVEGATLEQTELAVDELAKLHAAFWNKVDHLDWIPGIHASYHAENMFNLTRAGFEPMFEKFDDYLPASLREHQQRFLGSLDALQRGMAAAPITLAHGDYRMENLLFGTKANHDPVVVLDWQGPLLARGMNDVALFLTQSTKTEVRRTHEKSVIARYADGLEKFGVEGVDNASAWEDYRACTLYNWIYITVVAGTLDVSNQKSYAWIAESLARHGAACDDLNVWELLPQ